MKEPNRAKNREFLFEKHSFFQKFSCFMFVRNSDCQQYTYVCVCVCFFIQKTAPSKHTRFRPQTKRGIHCNGLGTIMIAFVNARVFISVTEQISLKFCVISS